MLHKFKKIDYSIVFILVILMGISILSIYSTTFGRPKLEGLPKSAVIFYILGFVVFFGMSMINYKFIIKNYLYIYGVGMLLLIFVMFFGKEYYGAKGWLSIFGVSLQPAELFKLCLIVFLSAFLARKKNRPLYFGRDVIPISLCVLPPLLLVLLQNDLGNALSYVVILVGLLWIGNIKFTHALIGFMIAVAAFIGGTQAYIHYHDEIVKFLNDIGRSHWADRFDPWLVPELTSRDVLWQTYNAKLAIGSGGITGKGYMEGTTIQSNRVPLAYADSIFVQIGEEFGFIGASVLLLLYFILIHRLVLIALECKDRAGPYLIVGIIAMLLYQIFVNIGPFIGLMPLTGITLPFISSGGTSIMINMISMGLVMSIKVHTEENEDILGSAEQPSITDLVRKLLRRKPSQQEQ
ncbi:rod shape-determining protein RodA [Paenibacillus sp. BGI2013]|uniref:Rod shape determining protein RodA n=2 Tax=Paenibacillus xylanexedens TaxID=528191 RepID=A0ABS4RXA5_PAEXY|nr:MULTISPECIES: FtsW/RodA/SpoVE family cell cycle protein [Paenibacillus]MBP2247522.1 rod shape determining protein RodA [Paenibacillus xylanexedens]MDQ0659942.1 rod shape determining protein RodA [Paenibacillus sp. W2I17]OMF39611.1 cell cycle protein [Paenibacillus amylolyticus]PKQ92369.1 rod shape-determining protein RodA [Paenibacillus sp. BGI2013]WFA84651.1 FtsW/RodA/SpoVE family cell cycle protein [Paenibacillus amylolyticus]